MPDSAPLPSDKLLPKVEELRVTTGPFPASRKIHAPGRLHCEMSVAMREIDLEAYSGEPAVRVYDTSGPYSDPAVETDINRGLPELRKPWILARDDVEFYEGREIKLCCKGCLDDFKKAPAKYVKKIETAEKKAAK